MRLGSLDPFPVSIILKVVRNQVNGASGVRHGRLLPQRDIPAFRWQNGGTRSLCKSHMCGRALTTAVPIAVRIFAETRPVRQTGFPVVRFWYTSGHVCLAQNRFGGWFWRIALRNACAGHRFCASRPCASGHGEARNGFARGKGRCRTRRDCPRGTEGADSGAVRPPWRSRLLRPRLQQRPLRRLWHCAGTGGLRRLWPAAERPARQSGQHPTNRAGARRAATATQIPRLNFDFPRH